MSQQYGTETQLARETPTNPGGYPAEQQRELSLRDDDLRSARHFDEGAKSYAAAYDEHSGSGHSFRARRSKAQSMLGQGPLGDLLDVGGASGVYFDALKSQVTSYHILDVSPLMIAEAKKIESGTVALFCHLASAYELPFPDNRFDTVIAMGVLEYLDQPWKGLQEMARVTKPGGVILISYPNIHSPMRRMSRSLYKLFSHPDPFSKSLLFSARETRETAAPLKIEAVELKGYNAQLIPFPLTWRLRRLSYYLAEALEPLLGKFGNLWGTSFSVKYKKLGTHAG